MPDTTVVCIDSLW